MIHQHLIANFKMNLLDSEIREYVDGLGQSTLLKKPRPDHIHVGIAPSFPYLISCNDQISKQSYTIDLYAQNVSRAMEGSYTGEISAQQIQDCGALGSIIGHSERRTLHHESSEIITDKMKILAKLNMRAIYCLGEESRDIPDKYLQHLIEDQISILNDFPPAHLILAYEPKWAIGTGQEADPQHIHKVSTYIRQYLEKIYSQKQAKNIPLLYGGSVNAKNLPPILEISNINGALVGSSSLDLEHFIALIELFINANL